MRIFQPIITGSIDVLGAITALSFTGSLQGTASYALSSSHALNAISTSYAQTASYADTFIVGGDITGSNALFTGTVTAQKLVIQTISSSVVYSSGSNVFGNDLSNTQVMTGSVNITGSLSVNNSLVILSNQTSSMSVLSASYADNSTSASYADNAISSSYANNATSASHALNADNAISASYANNATNASYAQNAESASFITGSGVEGAVALSITASYAEDANNATSASYALNSTSSSYAEVSTTASYALEATSASYVFNSTSASYALTASYAMNGGGGGISAITIADEGILQGTASYFDFIGDGVTTVVSNNTASITFTPVIITGSTSFLDQTTPATTWSFAHNLNSKYVNFEVYDSNDFVFIPAGIKVLDQNNAEIYFATNTTGKAVAQFSGIDGMSNALSASYATNALSASYAATSSHATNFTIDTTLNFAGTLTDYASVNSSVVGSNNIFTQATGSYTSAFFKYTVSNGSNTRAGEIIAAWNSSATEFTDFSTADLGTTNDVTSSVSLVGGDIQFNIQTNSSGWKIKSIGTFI
jgi:hypothetical protein